MTSALARAIAKSGYAVIAIDFRGHGENRNPFEVSGDGVQLRQDIDAALLFARTQPRFDGQRIALAGHSMGAFAVLAHAQQDPGVAAVVAISGHVARARPLRAAEHAPHLGGRRSRRAAQGRARVRREARGARAARRRQDLRRARARHRRAHERGARRRPHHDPVFRRSGAADRRAWLGETLGPGAGTPETPGARPALPVLGARPRRGAGARLRAAALRSRRSRRGSGSRPSRGRSRTCSLLVVALAAAVLVLSPAPTHSTSRGRRSRSCRSRPAATCSASSRWPGSILLALGARRRAASARRAADARTWLAAAVLFLALYAVSARWCCRSGTLPGDAPAALVPRRDGAACCPTSARPSVCCAARGARGCGCPRSASS